MKEYITTRSEKYNVSFLLNTKALIVIISLIFFSILMMVVGISVGSSFIAPTDLYKYFVEGEQGAYEFIINTLRLPRVLIAFMVGGLLSLSGLILQGVVKNPLASPDIIGITGGAKVAAVLYLTFFSMYSLKWLPLIAVMGAIVSFILIYILAWKDGISPIRLVLVGIGLQSGMSALVTMLIVISPTYSTSEAYIWLTGSVYGSNWADVWMMLPWVIGLVSISLLLARIISLQELGDDISTSLGLNIQKSRVLFVTISVALAGVAVAFAGGVGFVGLIAPHIARKVVDRSFGYLIPVSTMIGGVLVLSADIIARTLFLPLDLPAGVFVSGMGAPFFIYLLYRNRNM